MIKQMATGANHSVVLTKAGHLYAWGSNVYGECGIGGASLSGENSPTFSKEISDLQKIFSPQKVYAESLSKDGARDVQCGESSTGYLNDLGEVYAFGNNSEGQLGIGSNILNSCEPRRVVCDERIA